MIPIEPRFLPGWVWAAVTVGLMAGAGLAGWRYASALGAEKLAACNAAREMDARAAAEAAARRLIASQAAEAAVMAQLSLAKTRLAATEKRLKESLYALPTAQSCGLSAAARGLLNARLGANELPARAGLPDRAAAPVAADAGVREAELGGWITDAITAYDDCRARIDAIRQWDEVTHAGR